jgi:hypothetical protein
MTRSACVIAIFAGLITQLGAQTNNPKNTFGASVAYTDASSNIISGLSPDRRIFAVSGSYDRRLKRKSNFTYRWEIEVLPFVLIRNPRSVTDTLIDQSSIGLGRTTVHADTLPLTDCQSGITSGTYFVAGPMGAPTPAGTFTQTRTCSRQWVYSGGISPLGQRFNFRPGHRVQPFALGNAGFMASTRALPTSNSTRFNFTAQLGAGVEWFVSPRSSLALELQYHHLSNAGRGDVNPSIENALLKISYRYGH